MVAVGGGGVDGNGINHRTDWFPFFFPLSLSRRARMGEEERADPSKTLLIANNLPLAC